MVITEAYMPNPSHNYVEITNMGNQSINLSEFKLAQKGRGHGSPILDVFNDPWTVTNPTYSWFLPDFTLEAGASFVISTAMDFGPRQYNKDPFAVGANERPKRVDIYDVSDLLVHIPENNGDNTDSITLTPYHHNVLNNWDGDDCWFLEHHYTPGDSAVVDQVGGVFDNNGHNYGYTTPYSIAGVERAIQRSFMVRKFKFKTGNLDFANAIGVGDADSEWIPLIRTGDNWRDTWWITGNHGAYTLDESTLESDVIGIDFAGKKLTVPWGIGRLDGIMHNMKKKPGLAWYYHLNDIQEDSLYRSVRTGDRLEVIVCGNEKQTAIFDIVVSAPTADANIVVPKDYKNLNTPGTTGPITTRTQSGVLAWPRVTNHASGTDTITGSLRGLPYALRTDSLLKYLEKPSIAAWEFVWVDGTARPDLKHGDKLKVTSQNGSVKEYFIEMRPYAPNHNAYLSAITWPDVPVNLKGIYGWKGDTIPGFSGSNLSYKLEVPLDYNGIPALLAKTDNVNSKVEVIRATSLTGTLQDRTITFIVTAEDDSVQNVYNVELVKEKHPDKVQPFNGEPFISEWIYNSNWGNWFGEIANPGNQPLDLSDYMIVGYYGTDPSGHITGDSGLGSYAQRWKKYVPGYKWQSQLEWSITPRLLVPDLNVNSIVQPGDVFVMAWIGALAHTVSTTYPQWKWPGYYETDVNFSNLATLAPEYRNPWGEDMTRANTVVGQGITTHIMLFKILNDSIKQGLKPTNDPNDFQLIDNFGMADNTVWTICGKRFSDLTSFRRIPDIYKPNPVAGASFGLQNPDDCEWVYWDEAYWFREGGPFPLHGRIFVDLDVGKHTMIEPTHYKSTVNSIVYKVSDGYSMNEEIRGVTTGTTAEMFLNNILKVNEAQTLTVKSKADGTVLAGNAVIGNGDFLLVMSADSTNFSQYTLEVTDNGLNSDALLTSALYQITIESQPNTEGETIVAGVGNVSGFEYGTRLKTILNNISLPMGASMDVINSEGKYVSTKILNFDTTYVDVTVSSGIYLDVVAEDGLTRIVYQLLPSSSESDAFILSDVYTVSQSINLIQFIPRVTNVYSFLSYLVPSTGSTVKLVDKMGHERTDGGIAQDDKVVVTSANGLITKVYHLSMLRTQYILDSNYLAYIMSDVYAVDQVEYVVAGPVGTTLVTEFNSNISAAPGATAVIIDANGNEKTSGDLDVGDKVKVTSADGIMVVMYEIDVDVTSADKLAGSKIIVYPNPTSGKVNIQGVEQGTRIQVFNQTGALLRDIKTTRTLEILSLENQPSGMYLVVLTKNSGLIGQYKIVLK